MRANEFINEEQLDEIVPLIAAGARALAPMALKALGGAAARGLGGAVARKLGGGALGNTLGKVATQATNGLATTAGKAIGKQVSNYIGQKTTTPPQQATATTTQQSQRAPQIRTGDTLDIPNFGAAKVTKISGKKVTLQPDPKDPNTTITTDTDKLGTQ